MKMRKTSFLIVASLMVMSLAGCSTIKGMFPPSPQEIAQQKHEQALEKASQIKEDCNNSDVLLSNLTKPINKRVYSVKPGEVCNG